MSLGEFIDSYKSKTQRNKAIEFNNFSIQDRLDFLNTLTDTELKNFKTDIRSQAVDDFWTHERELIEDGKCTRDWTPDYGHFRKKRK